MGASFHRDHFYPKLVSAFGNPKPIQEVRRRILPLARGDVLEIGFGTGVNLSYYDPDRVRKLYALEPNHHLKNRESYSNASAERSRILVNSGC